MSSAIFRGISDRYSSDLNIFEIGLLFFKIAEISYCLGKINFLIG